MSNCEVELGDTHLVRDGSASAAGGGSLQEGSHTRDLTTESVAQTQTPARGHSLPVPATALLFWHGLGRSVRPICSAGRSLWRFLTVWGDKVSMAVVLVAAVIVLTQFASHVSRSGRGRETKNVRDARAIFRVEVRYLWVPDALVDLGRRQSRSPLIRDHGDLQHLLESQNREDLCYALTIRAHQFNDDYRDMTYYRHPYEDIDRLPELMDVLATVAGNPPRRTGELEYDFTTASVQIVPEDAWKRDPQQFIDEQLSRLTFGVDRKHGP